jgi:hypothetical protein
MTMLAWMEEHVTLGWLTFLQLCLRGHKVPRTKPDAMALREEVFKLSDVEYQKAVDGELPVVHHPLTGQRVWLLGGGRWCLYGFA